MKLRELSEFTDQGFTRASFKDAVRASLSQQKSDTMTGLMSQRNVPTECADAAYRPFLVVSL